MSFEKILPDGRMMRVVNQKYHLKILEIFRNNTEDYVIAPILGAIKAWQGNFRLTKANQPCFEYTKEGKHVLLKFDNPNALVGIGRILFRQERRSNLGAIGNTYLIVSRDFSLEGAVLESIYSGTVVLDEQIPTFESEGWGKTLLDLVRPGAVMEFSRGGFHPPLIRAIGELSWGQCHSLAKEMMPVSWSIGMTDICKLSKAVIQSIPISRNLWTRFSSENRVPKSGYVPGFNQSWEMLGPHPVRVKYELTQNNEFWDRYRGFYTRGGWWF